MRNHPLFCSEAEEEDPRRNIEISYVNIVRFANGKKETLANQWQPEQLLTPMDLFEAVGRVEGSYELIGRGTRNQVVDRQLVTLRAPPGGYSAPPQAPMPAQSPAQTPASPPSPGVMNLGNGLVMPSNIDPNLAMMMSIMAMNQQAQFQAAQSAAAMQQQTMQTIVTMMGGFQASQTGLLGSLATAFAPALAARTAPAANNDPLATENGFLKGIQVMAALRQGFDEANKSGSNWEGVTGNIAKAVQHLAEVAKTAASGGAPDVVIPPGAPSTPSTGGNS